MKSVFPIKVISVMKHFLPDCFAGITVPFLCLNWCSFHNKASGSHFFSLFMYITVLLAVYPANNKTFPVMVTGSCLSDLAFC